MLSKILLTLLVFAAIAAVVGMVMDDWKKDAWTGDEKVTRWTYVWVTGVLGAFGLVIALLLSAIWGF